MQQTPLHHNHNPDLLALMPPNLARVVEAGCSSGALAKQYLQANPKCDYIGLELVPEYAKVAELSGARIITKDVEKLTDADYQDFSPVDCWVFGDVLEHLYDPWKVLNGLRKSLAPNGCVVACIPNSQHWSFQASLTSGQFYYTDQGLLDRTHIRFFTRETIHDLFRSTGYVISVERSRVLVNEPFRDRALQGIAALAQALGVDPKVATQHATVFQWVVRADLAG